MKTKLLALLAFLAFPFCAWADGVEVDGIYYLLDEGTKTASVTYTGAKLYTVNDYAGDIVIPSSVTYDGTTYSVTSIGASAFYKCTGLTSINIPNSVTEIEMEAFVGCTGLTSVSIPNSVTTIGECAFADCTGLTSVTIPNSVTEIGENAFADCTGLKDVYALRTNPEKYRAHHAYRHCFNEVPTSTCTLHVPAGCSAAYNALYPWTRFENIVEDAK